MSYYHIEIIGEYRSGRLESTYYLIKCQESELDEFVKKTAQPLPGELFRWRIIREFDKYISP